MEHAFFDSIDPVKLYNKEIKPTYVPSRGVNVDKRVGLGRPPLISDTESLNARDSELPHFDNFTFTDGVLSEVSDDFQSQKEDDLVDFLVKSVEKEDQQIFKEREKAEALMRKSKADSYAAYKEVLDGITKVMKGVEVQLIILSVLKANNIRILTSTFRIRKTRLLLLPKTK